MDKNTATKNIVYDRCRERRVNRYKIVFFKISLQDLHILNRILLTSSSYKRIIIEFNDCFLYYVRIQRSL